MTEPSLLHRTWQLHRYVPLRDFLVPRIEDHAYAKALRARLPPALGLGAPYALVNLVELPCPRSEPRATWRNQFYFS